MQAYKIILLSFGFFLLFSNTSFSQQTNQNQDTITILNKNAGYMVNYDLLRRDELVSLLKTNMEAYEIYKGSGGSKTVAYSLSIIGGACIGFPIGRWAAGNDEPYWLLAAAGGAILAISIPFHQNVSGNTKAAVRKYNDDIKANQKKKAELSFYTGPASVGLLLKF